MKRVTKARNREEGSSKEKIEDEKAKRKIELKCASVDDLIDKLKAFKGALHNNQEFNTHLLSPTKKMKKWEKQRERKKKKFWPLHLSCICTPYLAPAHIWRIRAIPWRVRAVALVIFGRSYQVASCRHAHEWGPHVFRAPSRACAR
ncbi:hypothetical protein PIB30_062147 [Stylosanthes scabra]|uniref:Uncharacterized protein n=1 Tax=Stylosanthes scabra TaxID=79078 RepID=A0ABU6SLL2_9FABA|nr:hypothetical protein [Stylosanthes scabra]